MKLAKLSVLTLLIILITSMLTAQELDVSGHWEGVVSYEKEHLVIKFDFFKYSNSLVGACRIPEWEPDILGTSPLKVEGKKVSFQLSGFGSVILQYDDKFHRLRGQSVNRDGVFNFQLSKVILPAEKLLQQNLQCAFSGWCHLKGRIHHA